MRKSIKKTVKMFSNILPMVLGIVLIIGLIKAFIPPSVYTSIFSGNIIQDSFLGSVIGSILAGNPVQSYVIGGELLNQGVSLIAVAAFIIAWVTVGVVQLPAESKELGKKFALYRNAISFVFSIIVASLTVLLVNML